MSTFLLEEHREDGGEEEVDKSLSSLISIGGFVLGLVAFAFAIIL